VTPLSPLGVLQRPHRLSTFECNAGRRHSSVENHIQFDPIHLNQFELPITTSGEVCRIHSGAKREDGVKHHHRAATQQHIALTVMTKEAEHITALIASLRKSAHTIDKQRQQADVALRGTLDVRHNNLMATIAALQDRVSAIQGLIKLDRPYLAHRMH
jgi:hypothetical protein